MTLVELMVAVGITGILGTMAVSGYDYYMDKTRVARAVNDMLLIAQKLHEFRTNNRGLPDGLAAINLRTMRDPWGYPYQYLNLETQQGNGQARKRKNLAPLNSDYDLYSMGKDGASQSSLMAKASRDDVVRALDGRFMGRAADLDR